MKKLQKNALVDIGAIIVFFPMTISGIVIDFMNRGGGYEGGRNAEYIAEFLGMNKDIWIDIHTGAGYVFLLLIFVHLILHAGFIKNIAKYAIGSQKKPDECED